MKPATRDPRPSTFTAGWDRLAERHIAGEAWMPRQRRVGALARWARQHPWISNGIAFAAWCALLYAAVVLALAAGR